ncbi:MAG: hypothetical protein H6Q48_208 [Deltaproteobacteria bacterium]|nr:hypothetical protein [Deltaproteobacteria bacterium]
MHRERLLFIAVVFHGTDKKMVLLEYDSCLWGLQQALQAAGNRLLKKLLLSGRRAMKFPPSSRSGRDHDVGIILA